MPVRTYPARDDPKPALTPSALTRTPMLQATFETRGGEDGPTRLQAAERFMTRILITDSAGRVGRDRRRPLEVRGYELLGLEFRREFEDSPPQAGAQ